jgi:hypothetical protein
LIVVALLPVVALAGEARGEGDITKLVNQALDSSLKIPDREAALQKAVLLSHNKASPKRAEELRPGIAKLLHDLQPKRADPAYKNLISHTFSAFSCYPPDQELAALPRPFLGKDTPDDVRLYAITALNVHGAAAVSKEVIAIINEPAKAEQAHHEALEQAILLTLEATPGKEALEILNAATSQKVFGGVRVEAIRQLALMANTRPSEVSAPLMCSTLKPFVTDTNLEVAVTAAVTMQRFNSWEGIQALVQRCGTDAKKWSRETYRAVCGAVYAGGGFDGVTPETFPDVDSASRAIAVTSLLKRWEDVKSKSPEDVFWATLGGAGIKVPADKRSTDLVTALIDGLDSESREIRYTSLDAFVRKTGRTDVGRDFKTLIQKTGPARNQLEIRMPEPPDGFEEPDQAEKLRTQQKAIVKEVRSWWERNAKKAELKNDVWVVPPETPKKPK